MLQASSPFSFVDTSIGQGARNGMAFRNSPETLVYCVCGTTAIAFTVPESEKPVGLGESKWNGCWVDRCRAKVIGYVAAVETTALWHCCTAGPSFPKLCDIPNDFSSVRTEWVTVRLSGKIDFITQIECCLWLRRIVSRQTGIQVLMFGTVGAGFVFWAHWIERQAFYVQIASTTWNAALGVSRKKTFFARWLGHSTLTTDRIKFGEEIPIKHIPMNTDNIYTENIIWRQYQRLFYRTWND